MTKETDFLEAELKKLTTRIIEDSVNPFDAYVGHRLKIKRKALKLSQQQVAYILGVTFQQLQKYEKGTNKISSEKLWDLAYVMKVPFQFFFDGYDLFFNHLNALINHQSKKKQSQFAETEHSLLIQRDKNKLLSELKEQIDTPHNENEISSLFNQLSDEDVQAYCHTQIQEDENVFNPAATTTEDTLKRIQKLYEETYQSIEKNPPIIRKIKKRQKN